MILAGKGHEAFQIIGRDTVAFDDAEMVRAALVRRRSNSPVS